MRFVPVWLPLFLIFIIAGCTDPSPTFVFDAAPSVREAGTDAASDAVAETGAPEGGTGTDAGSDTAGDAP